MKVKDLTPLQKRIWIAARRYAGAELRYHETEYEYRSTGDPSDMPRAEKRRQAAANALLTAIGNIPMHHIEERIS